MNTLLLEKIKKALKSPRPLDAIKEIISEFEEVERLVKWREKVIIKGEQIDMHRSELDRILEIMKKYQYPYDIHEDSIDALIRKYLEQFK